MDKVNAFIRANYESMSDPELAQALNQANKTTHFNPNLIEHRRRRMGLKRKQAVSVPPQEEIKRDQERLTQRNESSSLKKKYEESLKRLSGAETALTNALQITSHTPNIHTIPVSKDGRSEATAVLLASDWHSDEIVEPSKVNMLNEFNPDIAKRRANRLFELFVRFLRVDRAESEINNLILWLGGDFFTSSEMHDAKVAFEPIVAAMYAQDLICSGIEFILEQEPKLNITVVGSVGNHSRIAGSAQKVNQVTEQERSMEWFMYHAIRNRYKSLNFILQNGYHTYVEVYGKQYRFNHGHLGWRYNDGLAGVHGPLWKTVSQKWDKQIPAAFTSCGHLHTYTPAARGRPYTVNGSLIGLSAYSMQFGFEEPIQGYYLIHSKYGVVNQRPLFVDS